MSLVHSQSSINYQNNSMTIILPMMPSEILGHIVSYFKENDLTTLMQCGDNLLRSKLKTNAKHMIMQVVPHIGVIANIAPIVQFHRLTNLKIQSVQHPIAKAPADFANNDLVVGQLIASCRLASLTSLDVEFYNDWEHSKWNLLIIDYVMPNLLHLRVNHRYVGERENPHFGSTLNFLHNLPKNLQTLNIHKSEGNGTWHFDNVVVDMSYLNNMVEFVHAGLHLSMCDKVSLPPNLESLQLHSTTLNIFEFTPHTLTSASFYRLICDTNGLILQLPNSLKSFSLLSNSFNTNRINLGRPLPPSLTSLNIPLDRRFHDIYILPSAIKHLERCHWDPVSEKSHAQVTQLISLKHPCDILEVCDRYSPRLHAPYLPPSLTMFETHFPINQSIFTNFILSSIPHHLTSLMVPACEIFPEHLTMLGSSLLHLSISIVDNSTTLNSKRIVWSYAQFEGLQTLLLNVGRKEDKNSEDVSNTLELPPNLKTLSISSRWKHLHIPFMPPNITHLKFTNNISLYGSISNMKDLKGLIIIDSSVTQFAHQTASLMRSTVTTIIKHGFPPSLKSMMLQTNPACREVVPIRTLLSALPRGMRSLIHRGEGRLFSTQDEDLSEMLHYTPQTLIHLEILIGDIELLPRGNDNQLFWHRQFCKQDNWCDTPMKKLCPHRSLISFIVNGIKIMF